MADSSKLTKLQLLVGGTTGDESLLLMYLDIAKSIILERLYPMDNLDDNTSRLLPLRYEFKQIEIAAYLYNKRGAEGELSHSENGINRTYESAYVPSSMLNDIIPYGSVL